MVWYNFLKESVIVNDMLKERSKQIRRLQQNLVSIRRIAGWTTEVLGNKIGVTKQTISNLENFKSSMTFTQYIAIRSVLDVEIASNPNNEVLPKVLALLLDNDDVDEEEYIKLQEVIETVAATAAGGTSSEKLYFLFDVLLKSLPFVIPILGAIMGSKSSWSKKLLK